MNHSQFHWSSILLLVGILLIQAEARSQEKPGSTPRGWRSNNGVNPDIVVGIDTTQGFDSKVSGFLHRVPAIPSVQVHMWQSIAADKYRGKRLRMTAHVKSKDVNSAFMYMRVEGAEYVLTFANTMKNPIKETTDWTVFQITLDVPAESKAIFFGAMLIDDGTIWLDDFRFEIVGETIPSDDMYAKRPAGEAKPRITKRDYLPNKEAMNLNFEDR